MITLVVVICHMLELISQPVCHEEVVIRSEQTLMACQMQSQIVIADWKEKSIYRGDQWTITNIGCFPGDYQPKDSI